MSLQPPVIQMPVIEGLFFGLLNSPKKINVVQGGGDAGKTVCILQVIATDLIENPKWIATVTAQDGPNLKSGALRAFQRYVQPYFQHEIRQYNISEKTFYFKNGSVLEFKSFQDEQDARGAERDILFMNEANSRPYEFFWQLQRKTRHRVYLDFNPTSSFWVHNKVIPGASELEKQFDGRVKCFLVDHRSNPYLTAEQHLEYESMSDPDLFQVYARGKVGKIKGLIYGHFKKCEGPPTNYDRIIWGIDYGYTNDPTVLVKVWCQGKKRWVKELCYRPGVSAQELKDLLKANGWQNGQTVWSEHDKHMINQLRVLGIPVYPAHKGPNSIAPRIANVRQHEVYYFDSPHLEDEIKGYKWVTIRDMTTGKEVMTNLPVDAHNHACVVGDTLIKTSIGQVPIKDITPGMQVLTRAGYKKVLAVHENGVKDTFRYSIYTKNGTFAITATENHLIKADLSWVPISKLQPTQTVYCSNPLTGKCTNYTKKKDTLAEGVKECMLLFMSIILAKFLKGMMCIIRMKTRTTTGLETLKLKKGTYIKEITSKKELKTIHSGLQNFKKRVLMRLKAGTSLKKAYSGTESMQKKHSSGFLISGLKTALNVKRNLLPKLKPRFFAVKNASHKIGERPELIMKKEPASFAVPILKLTNSAAPKPVQKSVVLSIDGSFAGQQQVYDLTVEDQHEYFANGLLLHNCDALGYSIYSDSLRNRAI